jgi:hypothetical protein
VGQYKGSELVALGTCGCVMRSQMCRYPRVDDPAGKRELSNGDNSTSSNDMRAVCGGDACAG